MWPWLRYALVDYSGRRVHKIDPYVVVCSYYIRVDFMYVGMASVHPWLIAMEGEYIRSTLIWWYAATIYETILCTLNSL